MSATDSKNAPRKVTVNEWNSFTDAMSSYHHDESKAAAKAYKANMKANNIDQRDKEWAKLCYHEDERNKWDGLNTNSQPARR
ncbi:hypothetical protein ABKA04_006514 [Annulohypoxylon sp. FPYF3050]